MIIHVLNDFDDKFVCPERDEIVEKIGSAYYEVCKKNVLMFGVDGKISRFVTPAPSLFNLFAKAQILPPEEYKLQEKPQISVIKPKRKLVA